jgi:hypothetical protein
MLHYNKIQVLVTKRDKRGKPVPFSLEAVSKNSGDIIRGEGCICTSTFVKTINVQWPSGEVRKLRKILFLKINDQEIIA